MFLDYYYIVLVIPALIIALAQFGVKSAFHKYNAIPNRRGYTGAMVARQILDCLLYTSDAADE